MDIDDTKKKVILCFCTLGDEISIAKIRIPEEKVENGVNTLALQGGMLRKEGIWDGPQWVDCSECSAKKESGFVNNSYFRIIFQPQASFLSQYLSGTSVPVSKDRVNDPDHI